MEENKVDSPAENIGSIADNQINLELIKTEYVALSSQITTLLSELKQHVESAIGSVESIEDFKSTASKHTEESNSLNEEIIKIKEEVDAVKSHIDAVKQEADGLKNETLIAKNLVDSAKSNADSNINSILDIKQTATVAAQEINGLLADLTEEMAEGEPSKMKSLQNCYVTALENKENIDSILAKISDYEVHVFGKDGQENTGIKHRLSEFEKKSFQSYEDWKTNYETLFDKIEGLLPGATSTGLAKAYQDQGKKHFLPFWIWTGIFVVATGGMIWFSIQNFEKPTGFQDALNGILSKIPFFVPAIWLAIFASKQQSKSKRLQEEYAYKETLSKSYESYKREVSALPNSETKQEMIEKLLQSMVEMMRFNPSETLQSLSHNDKPPIVGEIMRKFGMEKKSKDNTEILKPENN